MPSSSVSPQSAADARPPLNLLLAIALLSAALLSFEISLTRVFAVVLRYHFAFLVISVALCGLGVGGYAAHWLRGRNGLSLPALAALFGIAIDASLLAMLRGVFAHAPDAYWLAALIVLVPFSLGGAFLAEAFARWPKWSGRLYAWDLAGAALAAAGTVGVLQMMSAMSACAFAAIVASVAALLLVESKAPLWARWPGLVPLILLGIWLGDARWHFFDTPVLPPQLDQQGLSLADRGMTQPLFTELGTPGHTSRIVETRWNAFARTDVVFDPDLPNSYFLYTNGNVPTNMMAWSGRVSDINPIAAQFPLSDWAFSIAPLDKPNSKVLSIGPGGGLDALLALKYGAKRFDGAEINPSIPAIMCDYRKYNGGIYQRPDVNIVTADGRAFSRQALRRGEKYALVFSALTKTATAGQGMALLESFIHTSDAFDDYWQLLDDDGQSVMLLDNPLLLARFAATWLEVLARRGIDSKSAMTHIALLADSRPGPYQYAIVVQKSPFSRAQNAALFDATLRRRLTPIWIPRQAALPNYGPYPSLGDGTMNLAGFIDYFRHGVTPLDITPCPDDRPFVLDLTLGTLPIFGKLTAVAAALSLLLAILGLLFKGLSGRLQSTLDSGPSLENSAPEGPIPAPHSQQSLSLSVEANYPPQSTLESSVGARDFGWVFYFLLLGVGFLLIEIPLSQKLILPLGYPTLALSVILFSILLGGGVGSWFSQRFESQKLRRWAMMCALGVAIYGIGSTIFLERITAALPIMSLPARCLVAAFFLLPLGFLIGAPFPSGMRLFGARRAANIPLVWGLNGVASVVGSLCAAILGKAQGFDRVLLCGAAIYCFAAVLLHFLGEKEQVLAI